MAKEKGIIIYQSKYGATEKYAGWLREMTGFACVQASKAALDEVARYHVVVFCGGIYASGIAGLSFLKKNIGSLYMDGETLYAASHDGKLFKIKMKNFEIESSMKNVHKKMFDCAGIYEDMLITISHPCSEIAFWNRNTLEKIKIIDMPLKLSGQTHIENNFMYISSRNISGIDRIKLNEL